ncbi:antibiotic biosynthesis monooxygenase family protein [Propioniciclava soli]|uniref:antibiotic biosynthesis monooxygenase family protein n=1 Tax=Propioniciclava soli TaxID=2775081 RepID=UPI001E3485C4|nr:antibiotic biosynthesis monooxygenase [Propioniciclava soli]
MTIAKINAITVPADSGDELAHRFAQRAGAVDGQDGFEGFELLKPLDADRHVWLVLTRWRDEESFQGWMNSSNFRGAHGGRDTELSRQHGGVSPAAESTPTAFGEHPTASPTPRPVGLSAELWSYEVVDLG